MIYSGKLAPRSRNDPPRGARREDFLLLAHRRSYRKEHRLWKNNFHPKRANNKGKLMLNARHKITMEEHRLLLSEVLFFRPPPRGFTTQDVRSFRCASHIFTFADYDSAQLSHTLPLFLSMTLKSSRLHERLNPFITVCSSHFPPHSLHMSSRYEHIELSENGLRVNV